MSWWRTVLGLPEREQKTGLTRKQLEWARRVFSFEHGDLVCHFPKFQGDGYSLCLSTWKIQVHHIKPKGFWRTEGLFTDPDVPSNLIALCSDCHVGRRYKGTLNMREHVVPVVHPDMAWAYREYDNQGREGFEKVFAARDERTKEGKMYWNTFWDGLLQEIADRVVSNYVYHHPHDKFPRRRR